MHHLYFSDIPNAQVCAVMPNGADGAGTTAYDPHVGDRLFSICQALETGKNAVDERVRGLQTEILGAGEGGGGADGSGGSEALQKELLLTLTELAKASTEVPLGLMHLDPRCGSATDLGIFRIGFTNHRLTRSCSRPARFACSAVFR